MKASLIPKFVPIGPLDLEEYSFLSEVGVCIFRPNQQKNEVFRPKIGQFFGNFFENFQINKYHIITLSDKIVGQLEHFFSFSGSKW